MKSVILLLVLCFISSAFCVNWKSFFQNNDPFRTRLPLPETDVAMVEANSGCGNFSCTSTNNSYSDTCPQFFFAMESQCVNNQCTYTPDYSDNKCTTVGQCGTNSSCVCDSQDVSDGCKCPTGVYCSDGTCNASGVCELSGHIGEACEDGTICFAGVCTKDLTCQFVSDGDSCIEDDDCQPGSYCANSTCSEQPYCSEEAPGYCDDYGICINGNCYEPYGLEEGEPCLPGIQYFGLCGVGLACKNSSDDTYVCQSVALDSECETMLDCGFASQDCFCTAPSNNAPRACGDSGITACESQYQEFLTCMVEYGCMNDYDIMDNNTDCYEECWPLQMEVSCCGICSYPDFRDNAWPNVVGSCAESNVNIVECCDTVPCAISTTKDLCKNYDPSTFAKNKAKKH